MVFLGLGSNLGNREENLKQARRRLADNISDIRLSNIYETTPRYRIDQSDFFNLVLVGKTDLAPLELLNTAQSIESELGRDRSTGGWKGPRTIDIDLLLYNNLSIDLPSLVLPHPHIKERKFVLVPLLELEPNLVEPGTEKAYMDVLTRMEDQGIYYQSLNRYSFF